MMNFRGLYILLPILFFAMSLQSQTDIRVDIENYSSDTLLFGYYYWNKQYIKDSLFREKDGTFHIEYEKDLPHGMYMLITQPDNSFIQIVLDEDQKFRVSWDNESPFGSLKFKGSDENQLFNEYVSFLTGARNSADELKQRPDFDPSMMDSLNLEVKAFQKDLITDQPESMAALVIRSNEEIEVPEMEGSDTEIQEAQYRYYLEHFLDNLDLTDERLPHTPFFYDRIDRYMSKVVMQIPDSINRALDRILGDAHPAPNVFKVVLIHYLNKYAKSEYVGMDAVYVHLVDEYYSKGLTPWVDEESLAKMEDDASSLRPILIGKKAPEIIVRKKDGQPVNIYDIDAEYTVLLFWAPDCGHCQKALPQLKETYPELKEQDVEIIAVCTKLMDKEAECWKFIDEHGLDMWTNTSDKFLQSKFKQKYNVKSTPQVFVLDREKTIVSKKIAIEKLPEIIELLRKIETEKKKG